MDGSAIKLSSVGWFLGGRMPSPRPYVERRQMPGSAVCQPATTATATATATTGRGKNSERRKINAPVSQAVFDRDTATITTGAERS